MMATTETMLARKIIAPLSTALVATAAAAVLTLTIPTTTTIITANAAVTVTATARQRKHPRRSQRLNQNIPSQRMLTLVLFQSSQVMRRRSGTEI